MRQERKRFGEMGRGEGEEEGFHVGWGVDSKSGRRFGGKLLKFFGVGRFVCGGSEEACVCWLVGMFEWKFLAGRKGRRVVVGGELVGRDGD